MILLDQVSARELVRFAAATPGEHLPLPPIERRAIRASRLRTIALRVVLPMSFLALAVVSIAGVWAAVIRSAQDGDGLSTEDAALVGILAFATASALAQGFRLARLIPYRRLLPRRRGASGRADAEPARPVFLDLVSAAELVVVSDAGIGRSGAVAASTRITRRTVDTALWALLGAASVALLSLVTWRAGTSLLERIETVGLDVEVVVRAVLLALAALGVFLVARVMLEALLDRRRRRRRSATLRLLRQLLNLAGGRGRTAPGEARAAGFLAGVAVTALLVTSVGAWDAPGPGHPGHGALPDATSLPVPSIGEPAPLGSPGLGGASNRPATPWPAESTDPSAITASPTPPQLPSSSAPGTETPKPKPTPTPFVTPKPTPFVTPKPTPTEAETPQPTDDPDPDGDGVETLVEKTFGSDPGDPNSTPEDTVFDEAYGASSCIDGADNDLDSFTDSKDAGCVG